EGHLGAAVRLLQADVRGDLVVLPWHAHIAPARASAAERREKIREVEVLERESAVAELLLPAGRRAEILPRTMPAKLVVRGALLRVLERLVGLGDFLEFLLGVRLLGDVRVVLAGELAVRALD